MSHTKVTVILYSLYIVQNCMGDWVASETDLPLCFTFDRLRKHVLMLAYIFYMSTLTLTLELLHTLLVVIYYIDYSHASAGELLHTLTTIAHTTRSQ